MSVSAPKAIRIRTAEGWQDIAACGLRDMGGSDW